MVTVSPAITFIEKPLRSNGDPDYCEWLNEQISAGATSDNNLALEILKITGPIGEGGKKLSDDYLKRLDLSFKSVSEPYLEVIDEQFLKKLQKENGTSPIKIGERDLTIEESLRLISEFPVRVGTIPWLDRWLEKNETQLSALRCSSLKTGFYCPILGRPLLNASLAFPARMEAISRSLLTASMLRLGKEESRQAILDQLAVVRIGRTCQSSSAVLVQWNIGARIEHKGLKALQQSVLRRKLDRSDLQWLKVQLNDLPERRRFGSAQINADRVVILDAMILEGRLGSSDLSLLAYVDPDNIKAPPLMISDWNLVMKEVNQTFDRVEDIFEVENHEDRRREIENLNYSFEKIDVRSLASTFHFTAKQRGIAIGQLCSTLLCPDVLGPHDAEVVNIVLADMLRLCIALEESRLENDKYPSNLQQLVPKFLDALPKDLASAEPYGFNPDADSKVLIYSFGPNRKDDQGKSSDDSLESVDDIAVRRPIESIESWVMEFLGEHPQRDLTLGEVLELTKEIAKERLKELEKEKAQ